MIAYDPAARIFALGTSNNSIRLYSLAQPGTAPFATFNLDNNYAQPLEWTNMSISNDGKNILISTKGNTNYIVDAFDGNIKQYLKGQTNQIGFPFESSFTPDSKYVLGGSI